jgi:GH15 family glucan-1,4-alpha-glucosidase
MCSFWLLEALTRASAGIPEKLDEAKLLFERVLGYANHLGLSSEQTGPQGEVLGNFPQAFYASSADQRRIQSRSNAGQPSLNNASLSVKDLGGIHAGSETRMRDRKE